MIHKSILAAGLLIVVLIFTGCTAPGFNGTGVLSTVEIATAQPISATLPAEPTPEITAQASAPPETISSVAYIGEDGNVWLLDRAGGGAQQITTDAVLMTAGSTAEPIRYCCLGWSSDGLLLSYMREESVAVEGAYNYVYTFTVFDTAAHTGRAVLEGQPTVGYAWKPGSHLIAYGQPVDMRYWTSREAVPSQYAQGIWQLDADSGESVELAPAERGYTLVMPVWSGDGRYLAFEEIRLMQGRGDFAFFDLETGRYHALERVLGSYTWSPDGSRLAYDQIGYIPMGGERIWINTPDGGQESPFSPLFDEAWYAFAPSFSPDGTKIAYLVYQSDQTDPVDLVDQAQTTGQDTSHIFHLYVQDLNSPEARDYGAFEQVWKVYWTSDSRRVVFSAGAFDQKSVVEIDLLSGQVLTLAKGSEAIPQP